MHLKRLELFGFKTFADRTELEFLPGITAVVGPNGSGKSNIADAIQWVLGEQSMRSLRSLSSQDVIFLGSHRRKPLGFAEASLTFNNESRTLSLDFDEVTITRRLFRSGESEYLINKVACRLRDVTELFLDTGVGCDAYSIIGRARSTPSSPSARRTAGRWWRRRPGSRSTGCASATPRASWRRPRLT